MTRNRNIWTNIAAATVTAEYLSPLLTLITELVLNLIEKLPSFTFCFVFIHFSTENLVPKQNGSKINAGPSPKTEKDEKKTIILDQIHQIGEFLAYFHCINVITHLTITMKEHELFQQELINMDFALFISGKFPSHGVSFR